MARQGKEPVQGYVLERPLHELMEESHRTPHVPYTEAALKALSVGQDFVTPEMAKRLRLSCHYERQRKLRVEHINRLASEMKHGWFLAGTPIWMCVMPDKSMFIVNGNHTLEAIVQSSVSIPLTFVYQQVTSLEEVATIYACFDIQRMRTWMQAASAAGLADEIPLAKHVLAALSHIIADFGSGGNIDRIPELRSRPLRFQLMEEYKQAAAMLQVCLHGAPPDNARLVRRSGPMAVALVTTRYQPSSAEEFWRNMVWDDGLRKDDPRKVLLRYLTNHDTVGQQATRENTIAAANAWNAWFESRTLDHVRPSLSVRVSILGTPWAASQPTVKRSQKVQKGRMETGRRVTGQGIEEVVSYCE